MNILSYWKPILALLLIVGAFIGGRYTVQGKVEIREVEKIVEKEVFVKGKDTHAIEYRDRTITKVVVRAPDGTVTETTTDKDAGKTDTIKHETEYVTIEKVVEREKIVRGDAPRIHIDLMVGYSATRWEKLPAIGNEHLIMGVNANVRVLGPFTVGAFVLSSGAAGGTIGATF